ncbi:unnamed protein product, partial [Nesidiocoris tenuis]
MLKKVLNEALRRPGAKSRLGQVLPIVRLMTPPQKLALASLVMAQVLAGPNDPPPPVSDSKNMTSQLMLPISMDIATMFRGMGKEQSSAASSDADKNEGRSNNIAAMVGIYAPQRVALGPNIRRPPPTLTGISRRNANIQNGSIEHPDTNLVGNDEAPVVRIPAPPPPPPPLPPTTTSINKGHGVRVRPYAPPKRRPAVQHRGPPLPIEGETHPNEDSRYPPYDNNLRRITRNNTVDSRVKYTTHLLMPPSPNNRHPALPIDTLHADSVPTVTILPNPTTGHGHTTRPTHDHGHGHDNGHGHDHGISTGPPNYTVSTGPPHHSVATGPPSHGIATGPPSHGPSASTPNRRVNYSYHPIIDYFRPQIPQMAENRMGVDWTPIVERRRGKSADESSEEPEKLET